MSWYRIARLGIVQSDQCQLVKKNKAARSIRSERDVQTREDFQTAVSPSHAGSLQCLPPTKKEERVYRDRKWGSLSSWS